MSERCDFLVIGGGIVGLSTAWQLQQQQSEARIILLEKENGLAQHQSGHNSGVIHAGIYYAPGSLKARFCKQGMQDTIAFCQANTIEYEQCGKLLVATDELELQRMQQLYTRALENGLDVQLLNQAELNRLEPNIFGLGGILVSTTGIVDYRQVCQKMAEQFQALGGILHLDQQVRQIQETATGVEVHTQNTEYQTGFLIACAGLGADRVTRLMGIETDFHIVPFRGEYYRLPSEKSSLIKHLIYPIPDPDLPFLGVHLTRMINGDITVGPNAVPGFKREGYGRINFSLRDTLDMALFPGYWKMARTHLKTGMSEMYNSWWKPGYLQLVKKYYPAIQLSDLKPYPAGIRAQAIMSDGTLVHDFLFAETAHSLHVCNAPSPAATSSIPIGGHIVGKVLQAVNG